MNFNSKVIRYVAASKCQPPTTTHNHNKIKRHNHQQHYETKAQATQQPKARQEARPVAEAFRMETSFEIRIIPTQHTAHKTPRT